MKKWRVGGGISASTYVGEFEADTWLEAVEKAYKVAGVSVCHECAEHISDPEIDHLWAEDVETGDCTSEPTLGDQVSEQAREIERLLAALEEYHRGADSVPYAQWTPAMHKAQEAIDKAKAKVKP